jgi:hypothetical protein
MVQGRFEKLQDVVGAMRIARPQSVVATMRAFRDKGQQRVMAFRAPDGWGYSRVWRLLSSPLCVRPKESTSRVTCFKAPILPKNQR